MGAGAVGMATNSNAVGSMPGDLPPPPSLPFPAPVPEEGEEPFFAPVPAGEPFRLCLPTEDVAFFPEEGVFSEDLAPRVFDAFGAPDDDGDDDDEVTFFGVIAAR